MDDSVDTISRTLNKARACGADAADAVIFETISLSTTERLGKSEGLERSESAALGLRVFVGTQQACVSSTDVSQAALDELAERAVTMAKCTPADPDSALAPETLYPPQLSDLDLFDGEEPSEAWLKNQCREAEETARAVEGITNSEGADAGYSKSVTSLGIANGKGVTFAKSYPSSHFSVSVSVLAGNGTGMERDYDYSSTRHRADLEPAANIGKSAAERALKRLHPRKVATCRVPVVFDPRVSKQLLGIFASAISGNSVARGASFLKDDMGKTVFAKEVTIVDDPCIKRGLASRPFDAEGVDSRPLVMVENGVLQHWLLDMRTANKLGLTTTGHASRGIASPPSPSASNLYMEKGNISPGQMIKDIKNGFYVTETFGMGVNVVTGDYSQGASGFWIESGEIAYPVSEITMAGRLADMFAHLMPADDLHFRYATNAPTLRVDSMTVAGA